ncbi:hypothetical protein LIER_37009 [Lithospermum erythrorhizon]|uniref:Uncharacterized protein n=1 Tax=Lithospermum erythrorhizon TaxID=34254 RepID=A0AAV3PF43_LITER
MRKAQRRKGFKCERHNQERTLGAPYSVGCYDYVTLGCLGDFNCFLSPQDKRGGRPMTTYLFRDLKEFVVASGLVDALTKGYFYTWTNGTLWFKLDRVLMNPVWSDLGVLCTIEFLSMEPASDHCPVLATIVAQPQRGTHTFKFLRVP